jgi:thioredoxin 1
MKNTQTLTRRGADMKNPRFILKVLVLLLLSFSCSRAPSTPAAGEDPAGQGPEKPLSAKEEPEMASENIKVTFIELGSVNCIPCKMMQPVMDQIKEEYKGQVKVVFYDVWDPLGKPYGEKYNIRLIPTQVFLDRNGKEYFRHEGFFPKEELIKVLQQGGVK